MIKSRTAIESLNRYKTDPKFRAIAISVAHEAMGEYIRRNPDADHREADRLAMNVATIVMDRLFKEDAELWAQREIADRYKKIAEDALALSTNPLPMLRRVD